MIFLKAIVMVLTAVSSLEFVFPAQGEIVNRAQQTFTAHWNEDYPVVDLPDYQLGICSSDSCYATNKHVHTSDENVELDIEEYFPVNGVFRFCVFLYGTPIKSPALYEGPSFRIIG